METAFVSVMWAVSATVGAQLSGSVGPLTSYSDKANAKICDISDYGAVEGDSTNDVGLALQDALEDCASGGLVYIPPGDYYISTTVTLSGGTGIALQHDGVLYRNGDIDGDQILTIENSSDGYGYEYLADGNYGIRLARFVNVTDFSIHGMAWVDSPSYYLVLDTCTNGEVYNLIIRGISVGATDAIDIWGDNIWVHDVEVTNGDECVCVKSPAANVQIENIYCNWSGGTTIGSLGVDASVSNVAYHNLYMSQADAGFVKWNGASGSLRNVIWDTVIQHGGSYLLSLDGFWGDQGDGDGLEVYNLTFTNWHGYNSDNSRPTIRLLCSVNRLLCSVNNTCTDIVVDDVALWTDSGVDATWTCENAYGSGACLESDGHAGDSYTTTTTITATPAYSTSTMADDLSTPFPSTQSFTIPTVPTSFYPGVTPISSLLKLTTAGGLA
ncbi:rhamnogalacturonase A [Aspergillus aculeatinus CBS 121060]|uniref:Rhamnogalacturonase A n=1 Tax=Aspergillus aculeatinus CBS 121060 TaxID=1448322 RepID=A0ACD1HAJ5_9EURO|nr:rhamnogalacturonase A [Aspergillus aculeatinus CBS 121060]RAH70499.1 rhamnogalacturonase A [Aspergillus aculeatinus CBS 121060]